VDAASGRQLTPAAASGQCRGADPGQRRRQESVHHRPGRRLHIWDAAGERIPAPHRWGGRSGSLASSDRRFWRGHVRRLREQPGFALRRRGGPAIDPVLRSSAGFTDRRRSDCRRSCRMAVALTLRRRARLPALGTSNLAGARSVAGSSRRQVGDVVQAGFVPFCTPRRPRSRPTGRAGESARFSGGLRGVPVRLWTGDGSGRARTQRAHEVVTDRRSGSGTTERSLRESRWHMKSRDGSGLSPDRSLLVDWAEHPSGATR